MQKVTAIMQARMGASRLPGKVLMPVAGMTFLEFELRQLAEATSIGQIIIATTEKSADDPIAALGSRLNVPVFRGSEQDVLDRYHGATEMAGAEHVMRVTGDCPLIQPNVCDRVVQEYFRQGADYCRTAESFAEGLDCEVLSRKALDEAWKEATLPSEREHMTLFVRNRPARYVLLEIENDTQDGQYRLTLDEPQDREVLVAVIEALFDPSRPYITIGEAKAWLDAHPEVFARNADILRNEGLVKSLEGDHALDKKPH